MLIYVSVVSYGIAFLLLTYLFVHRFIRKQAMAPIERDLLKRRKEASLKKNNSIKHVLKVFEVYKKLPLVRTLVHQLMTSFSLIGEKDQNFLMKKVVLLLSTLLCADVFLLFLFWQITHNLLYLGIFLFFLWYVAGSYLDFFVANGHLRLLEQMVTFIGLVRQKYYEYGMIDDAVYEATVALNEADREMAVHGERIYEILLESQNDKLMTAYNETAPNPYLKMFLNLSYMTMEYGDQKVNDQSVFLMNLSFLTKNIYLEIDKRKRLNYALKSMNIIVMLPLLLMSLIKGWAVSSFPPLGFFYRSPMGKYIEVITILLMLIAMVLLNKIQRVDSNQTSGDVFRKVVLKIKLPLSETYKRKWLYLICGFSITLIIFASIQQTSKWKIKEMVYYESQFLGAALDEETYKRRLEESRIDYEFIKSQPKIMTKAKPNDKLNDKTNDKTNVKPNEEQFIKQQEAIHGWISSLTSDQTEEQNISGSFTAQQMEREEQIYEKITLYQSYYLRLWHILCALFVGILGYYLPEISVYLSRKMKEMDIDDEVAGFRSIIMMLMHHPRMNVEEIGIWLESYAVYYKNSLHRCLLDLASGEYKAIMDMHNRTDHKEMKRLLYQLAMASEDIKLEEAFDELIQEKNTFFEQRKWQNEKLINRKMIMGQNIGFLPAYSLIILYMIVPMIIASTNELNRFFAQM